MPRRLTVSSVGTGCRATTFLWYLSIRSVTALGGEGNALAMANGQQREGKGERQKSVLRSCASEVPRESQGSGRAGRPTCVQAYRRLCSDRAPKGERVVLEDEVRAKSAAGENGIQGDDFSFFGFAAGRLLSSARGSQNGRSSWVRVWWW
jgi:hypothetical protein